LSVGEDEMAVVTLKNRSNWVPARVGAANGFHRRASQSGMVGAEDADVATCQECGDVVPSDHIYQGWCFSCVTRWGHPDDVCDVIALSHGWTHEAAVAASVSARKPVAPIVLAVQSFGTVDLTTDKKTCISFVNVDARTSHTAGDGFLFDDQPSGRRCGRMPLEMKNHFRNAVARLMQAGFSIRAIARVTGLSRITIRNYREEMCVPHVCECGAEARHQGWCWARFQASKRRQDFMRRWHKRGEWACKPKDGFVLAWPYRSSE
jgi:hypothetical protein